MGVAKFLADAGLATADGVPNCLPYLLPIFQLYTPIASNFTKYPIISLGPGKKIILSGKKNHGQGMTDETEKKIEANDSKHERQTTRKQTPHPRTTKTNRTPLPYPEQKNKPNAVPPNKKWNWNHLNSNLN